MSQFKIINLSNGTVSFAAGGVLQPGGSRPVDVISLELKRLEAKGHIKIEVLPIDPTAPADLSSDYAPDVRQDGLTSLRATFPIVTNIEEPEGTYSVGDMGKLLRNVFDDGSKSFQVMLSEMEIGDVLQGKNVGVNPLFLWVDEFFLLHLPNSASASSGMVAPNGSWMLTKVSDNSADIVGNVVED